MDGELQIQDIDDLPDDMRLRREPEGTPEAGGPPFVTPRPGLNIDVNEDADEADEESGV